MFILIKRELQDNLPHIAAGIVIMLFIMFINTNGFNSRASFGKAEPENCLTWSGCVIPLLAGLYAAVQLYLDKSGKISLFQMSLPVTRTRLYLSLTLVGITVLAIVTISTWFILNIILEYHKFELTFSLFPIFGLIFLMSLTAYASSLLISISEIRRRLKCVLYLLCYISILFFVFYNGLKIQTITGLIIWSICALIWSHNKYAVKAI